MITKKGTPKEIKYKREWDSGKFGKIYYFDVIFEDDSKGEMSTNKVDVIDGRINQKKFEIGKEVEYTTEDKTTKNGKEYVKVDLPKGEKGSFTGKRWNDPEKQARIVRSVCLECAIRLMKYKPEDVKDLGPTQLSFKLAEWITSKGSDESDNISAQTAMKKAILTYEIADKKPDSLTILLSNAETYYKYINPPKDE